MLYTNAEQLQKQLFTQKWRAGNAINLMHRMLTVDCNVDLV